MVKFYSKIVGSTFCKGQELMQTLESGEELLIIPEPENRFDQQAVKVCLMDGHKTQLGYLPKDTAHGIFADLTEGFEYKVTVSEVTGGKGEKSFLGCNIQLERIFSWW